MLYSASEAPISWASLLFILPNLLIGSFLLWSTFRKRVVIQGGSTDSGLAVQALGGAVFFALASWLIVTKTRETIECRAAAADNKLTTAQGPIVVEERFTKIGYSFIRFSVGEHRLRTETQGLSCDCGYLQPVGKSVTISDGLNVRVGMLRGKVITMERLE